jgi:hypothetical protein
MAPNQNYYTFTLRPYPSGRIDVTVIESTWYPHRGRAARQVMAWETNRDDLQSSLYTAALTVLSLERREREGEGRPT